MSKLAKYEGGQWRSVPQLKALDRGSVVKFVDEYLAYRVTGGSINVLMLMSERIRKVLQIRMKKYLSDTRQESMESWFLEVMKEEENKTMHLDFARKLKLVVGAQDRLEALKMIEDVKMKVDTNISLLDRVTDLTLDFESAVELAQNQGVSNKKLVKSFVSKLKPNSLKRLVESEECTALDEAYGKAMDWLMLQ